MNGFCGADEVPRGNADGVPHGNPVPLTRSVFVLKKGALFNTDLLHLLHTALSLTILNCLSATEGAVDHSGDKSVPAEPEIHEELHMNSTSGL